MANVGVQQDSTQSKSYVRKEYGISYLVLPIFLIIIVAACIYYFTALDRPPVVKLDTPINITNNAIMDQVKIVPRDDIKTPDNGNAYNIIETEGSGFHRIMVTSFPDSTGNIGRITLYVRPLSKLRGQLRLEYSELAHSGGAQVGYGRADIVLTDDVKKDGEVGDVKVRQLQDNWYMVSADFPTGHGIPTLSIDMMANGEGVLYKGVSGEGLTVGAPHWVTLQQE